MSSFPVSNLRSEPLPLWHKIDNRYLWKNVTKWKGWEGPRWLWDVEHGLLESGKKTGSGFGGFEPQTSKSSSLGRERSAVNHFASTIANRELIDSHTIPLFIFLPLSYFPGFQHILNLQNCFVSEGATQDSSLSLWVSDTEVWQFIWSVSQPGSEDRLYLCSLAQSLSAFGQILYPPARRDW